MASSIFLSEFQLMGIHVGRQGEARPHIRLGVGGYASKTATRMRSGKSTVRINPIDHSSNFNSKSPFSIRTHILKVSTFHCYVTLMVFICFGSIRISFSLPKNPRISKTTIATFLTSGSSPNKTVALWVELFDSHDPRCQ